MAKALLPRRLRPRRLARAGRSRHAEAGFTLLELIVVVAMIGILAAIALPSLVEMPRRAKEATLKTNLRTIREVIDQHYGDKGFYPPSLEVLVEDGYLRDVPIDPITADTDWELIYEDFSGEEDYYPAETDGSEDGAPGVIDVKSSSDEESLDQRRR